MVLVLGGEFKDMDAVRNCIYEHSIKSGASYFLKRSSPNHLKAVCYSNQNQSKQGETTSCPFMICANCHKDNTVRISSLILEHAPHCFVERTIPTKV